MYNLSNDLHKICDLKKTLLCWLEQEIGEGKENVACHAEKLGEITDMIKDLAETEEKCVKAKYYSTVTEAMKEFEDAPMGYDAWKYSNGRYAPKGKGHYVGNPGYTPDSPNRARMLDDDDRIKMGYPYDPFRPNERLMMKDNLSDYRYDFPKRMGYMPMDQMDPDWMPSRYGMWYDDYLNAKKHYTNEKTPENAKHMNSKIQEGIGDSLMAINEMWKDASPETKKKIEEEFSETLMAMRKDTNGGR